jgi:hypothetical protein
MAAEEVPVVERLRDDEGGLGNGEASELVQRHSRAVGIHVHAVEDRDHEQQPAQERIELDRQPPARTDCQPAWEVPR